MTRPLAIIAAALAPALLAACASQPALSPQSSLDRAIDAERLHTISWNFNYSPVTIRSLVVQDSNPSPSGLRTARCRVEIMADGDEPITLHETPLRILLASLTVQSPIGPIDLFEPNGNNLHIHFVAGKQPEFVVTPKHPTRLSVVLPFHHLAPDLPPGPLVLAAIPEKPMQFAGFTKVTAAGPVNVE